MADRKKNREQVLEWGKPTAAISTLSNSPLKYNGRTVKSIWVLAVSLGYGSNGKVVVSPNSVGSLVGPIAGKVCVRLFRAEAGRFRLVAVAGIERYGLEKQDRQKPGQYWLPEAYKAEVLVSKPLQGVHARTISEAIPGQTIRISNVKTASVPNLQKSDYLLKRSAELRSDGAGIPMIYLGDIGLVGSGPSGWIQYEIVPQDPSGLSKH